MHVFAFASNETSSSYGKMPTNTRDCHSSHVTFFYQTMVDIFLTGSWHEDKDHSDELYQLVVRGATTELKRRLGELPDAMEYLTAVRWYGEERLSLLMVAALHGHDQIVRFLLTFDSADQQLKSCGKILNVDQKIMNGVNPLYCACYRGHFHVAKTLIELGKADVNEDSWDYLHHPLLLRAAINNRLDIVQFLVENRYADVNKTKSRDYSRLTALICAVRDGHTSLAQYLLESGADVNYCSPNSYQGAGTALMVAAENDCLKLFVLLHHHGATMNHSVLRLAVKRKSYSILRFLLNESLITPNQLELEAASSPSWSSQIAVLDNRVEILKISLEYRERMGVRKVCPPPLLIYDYEQECQTIDEFESIVHDRDRLLIELVLIQDRLQSAEEQSTRIELLEEYSLILVEKKRFDTCLDLCHHVFDLSEQQEGGSSLHLFIWLFCEMLSSDDRLPIDHFLRVANLIFRPSYRNDTERSLNNALFMVILATKVAFSHPIVTLPTIAL
jgi:ankyrin repeat protein